MWKAWQLAALEDQGMMDTNTGLIHRVARILADSPNETIGTEEFRRACLAGGVDPDSFTPDDLAQLQRKLSEIT